MRRRSERKKSTDVPSSPAAQPQRRSTRRRKSPSFSETEKSDERDVGVLAGSSEAEQENTQRDSSEERTESRRNRGRGRSTPVKESPAKRKLKREASPVAKKIDAIPEEENGSLTERVDEDADADEIVKNKKHEEQEQLNNEKNVKEKEEEEEENDGENVGKIVEKMVEATVAVVVNQGSDEKPTPYQEVPERSEMAPSANVKDDTAVERSNAERDDKSVEKIAENMEADEVSKRDVGVVEEFDDTMTIMSESLRESQSSPAPESVSSSAPPPQPPMPDPIAEQHQENTGDDSNDATTLANQEDADGDVRKGKKAETEDQEASKVLPRVEAEDSSRHNDRHYLSRDNANNTNSNDDSGRRTRKRKWITKKCTEGQTPVLAISTKSLKNLIADVHPVPLSDVQLESSSEIEEVASEREEGEESPSPEREPRDSRDRRRISLDVQEQRDRDRDRPTLKRRISKSNDHQNAATVATAATASASSAGVGGGASSVGVQRSPSPALNKTSNVLFITNLVRPFTVLQLKGLLARTGKIVEDGFWIDRIKSKCYVEYETEDEAIETRHALHGVRWPVSNPKCLNVEFGAKADMESAIESTKVDAPKYSVDNNKDNNIVVGSGWSRERGGGDNDAKRSVTKPVREWDVGKKDSHLDRPDRMKDTEMRNSRERDLSENRENHKNEKDKTNRSKGRDLRSSSLSPVRKVKKKENEPPLRLLDDLFRKTKTSPCIYWLPLTPEQIAEKEAFRQKRIEEHKQRLKQKELERGKDRERERERDKDRSRGNERDHRERDREKDTRDREHRRNRSSDRRRSRSRDKRRY